MTKLFSEVATFETLHVNYHFEIDCRHMYMKNFCLSHLAQLCTHTVKKKMDGFKGCSFNSA